MIHLISGGARSGKSRFAEDIALRHAGEVCYIATAEVRDAEFAERVAHHRARRPAHWQLEESGQALAQALRAASRPGRLLLVDCLGMWLMRFFTMDDHFDEARFASERQALLETLPGLSSDVLLVTNEVGWGVVAPYAMTRRFVDEMGRLSQDIASVAEQVTLVACGLPLPLKSSGAGA